jgi:hypothetical protein
MKTNHKQTYSYASAFKPLLRYVTTRNLAVAMFIAVALLGTTRGNETEKTLSQGSLVVYSATDAFEDGDVPYYAHSSYTIYTADGKLFKNVENHMSRSDEIPELVTLPVGSYVVEARSERDGYVRVPVVIKAGRQTIVDLNSTDKESPSAIVSNQAPENPRRFTKDRMNTFDLRAALLAKHAQPPIINPRTHGIEHGSNAWLTNSKLLPSRVCAGKGGHQFFASALLFSDNNKEYLTGS